MKRELSKKIKQSFECAHNFSEFIFQLGYSGVELPRSVRCILAKTSIHQQWMSGFYGGGILKILDRQAEENELSLHDKNVKSYYEAYNLGYSSESSFSSNTCPPSDSEEWFINAWLQGRSDASHNSAFN